MVALVLDVVVLDEECRTLHPIVVLPATLGLRWRGVGVVLCPGVFEFRDPLCGLVMWVLRRVRVDEIYLLGALT